MVRSRKTLSFRRRVTLPAALVSVTLAGVSLTTLTGCSDDIEPVPLTDADPAPVRVSAYTGEYTDITMNLYAQVFRASNAGREEKRDVTVNQAEDSVENAVESLRTGENSLVLMCSGDLLEYLNRDRAEAILKDRKEQAAKGKKVGLEDERVWREVAAALPSDLGFSTPAAAHCLPKDKVAKGVTTNPDEVTLPQNIMPIYLKPAMGVEDRHALNWVSGALTTEELSDLQDKTKSEDGSVVARNYLRQRGLVFSKD